MPKPRLRKKWLQLRLMGDLEKRLRRLSGTTKREASGASDDIGEFVSDALDRIMGRVRESAAGVASRSPMKPSASVVTHSEN